MKSCFLQLSLSALLAWTQMDEALKKYSAYAPLFRSSFRLCGWGQFYFVWRSLVADLTSVADTFFTG